MPPTIAIPETLAHDLARCVERIEAEINLAAAGGPDAIEIAKLAATEAELQAAIPALKIEALTDSDAADRLVANDKRAELISSRLAVLRARITPPNMIAACAAIDELTRFYLPRIKEQFIEWNRPFFNPEQPHAIAQMANQLPAVRAVIYLRTWSSSFASTAASPGNVATLKAVVRRALAGQINLCRDQIETEASVAS
jgi:hypothetical protein